MFDFCFKINFLVSLILIAIVFVALIDSLSALSVVRLMNVLCESDPLACWLACVFFLIFNFYFQKWWFYCMYLFGLCVHEQVKLI